MEDDDDRPSTPPGSISNNASAIIRPPSADLNQETTPEDDPMVQHMHLHVSPSRGEVHAHGRWHKYVKPRIGPGFQVKADAIPEVGDGLIGGERGTAASMSRDSSAADLASVQSASSKAEEQQGTTATRRSGRSSAGSRRGSRSSSGRSTPTNSNSSKPDERELQYCSKYFVQTD